MIIDFNKSSMNEVKEGISVITATKDRNKNLKKALKSWLSFPEIDEIIIVDWDSKESPRKMINSFGDKRIILVEVKNQPMWVLSKAFNLAATCTTRNKILKLDADIILKEGFFEFHVLEKGDFISGDWRIRKSKDKSEFGLSGLLYCFRDDFFKTGGYDEIIQTYGRDDIKMYDDLISAGLTRKCVNSKKLSHIFHDDFSRIKNQHGVTSLQGEMKINDVRFRIRSLTNVDKRRSRYRLKKIIKNRLLVNEIEEFADGTRLEMEIYKLMRPNHIGNSDSEVKCRKMHHLLSLQNFEKIFNELKGKKIGFVLMSGNVGDDLITDSAIQLLKYFKIDFKFVNKKGREWEFDDSVCRSVDEFLVNGGGNIGALYAFDLAIRKSLFRYNKPITILPQTFCEIREDLPYKKVWVRETRSLAYRCDAFLAPDLALGYTLKFDLPEASEEIGLFLRTDIEKSIDHNLSIGDPIEMCKNSEEYIKLAANYKLIITNRLHFAIAGLIARRQVILLHNSYFKNEAVWEAWLRGLGCIFDATGESIKQMNNPIKFMERYNERREEKLINEINGLIAVLKLENSK